MAQFAFVPGRLTFAFDPGVVLGHLANLDPNAADGADQIEIARYFLGDGRLLPWTLLTYAFLHGNWAHVGLNSVWLLAFGTPLARRFKAWRFYAFLAASAIVGALTHYLVYPLDLQPLIGASAAVSGCMAASLRFMFQPDRPVALGRSDAVARAIEHSPTVPIRRMLRDRRAVSFLVVWFVTNLITGVGAIALGLSDAPIAWQAHIGGFVFGLFAFRWFDPVPQDDEAAFPETTEPEETPGPVA